MSHDQSEQSEKGFWETIQERLKVEGLDMEALCGGPAVGALKLVCVPSSLRDSVEKTGASPRDQVLMVRVGGDTMTTLDSWVQTGAVKSRSEAAAVFIREGLKVREQELQELEGALADVESAKERLRKKAKQVLDQDDVSEDPAAADN